MGNPYGTQISGFSGSLGRIGGQYGTLAGQARTFANRYRPQQYGAIDTLASFLRQGTDPASIARNVAGQAGVQNNAGLAALAQLKAHNAMDGNPDAFGAGQEALIRSQMANNVGGAINNASTTANQQHLQNLNALSNLYGSIVGQSNQDEMGALGQEQGIDSGLLQTYLALSQQEKQRQAQAKAGLLGGITGLLGPAAQLYGMTRSAPKPLLVDVPFSVGF